MIINPNLWMSDIVHTPNGEAKLVSSDLRVHSLNHQNVPFHGFYHQFLTYKTYVCLCV